MRSVSGSASATPTPVLVKTHPRSLPASARGNRAPCRRRSSGCRADAACQLLAGEHKKADLRQAAHSPPCLSMYRASRPRMIRYDDSDSGRSNLSPGGRLLNDNFDETHLNELIGKVIGDVAGALSLYMAYLGDQAGVFAALDGAGRLTLDELAAKTGLNPKYLREWLGSVSAAGYVNYHAEDETFSITPEQALV